MQVGEFVWDLPHECLIGLDRRAENCLYARIVFNRRCPQSEPGASELFVLFGEMLRCLAYTPLWREFEANEMIEDP